MTDPRITRDRDEIETWADEHDTVPVREEDQVRLVHENDVTETHERLDWDTFHQEVDEEDHVVTYRGETGDRAPFEVNDRDTALDRAVSESDEFDREEAERRLIEGETITGTVTETTVVEETIVEETTLESEVVDRETIDRNVVDVELLERECQACDIVGEDADFDYAGSYGTDRFLTDDASTGSTEQYGEYPFDVTVEVREDWAATIEERDRYTVETNITDVDVSETDEVEARDLEAEIDVDAVHQQLLDSGIVDIDADAREEGEVIDTETYDIESEFTDEDVLTTYLTSRRQFEREISERSRLTTEVVEGELLDREIVGEEAVETGLAERDVTAVETETDTEVEYETDTTVETETEYETDTAVETDTEYETDAEEVRILPDENDEGKPVIDETGDEIGEVIDVDDGVAFVDPHPSLTEKIMARLGADEDEEYYRLREDRIDRITDDEIVVSTGELDDERREDVR